MTCYASSSVNVNNIRDAVGHHQNEANLTQLILNLSQILVTQQLSPDDYKRIVSWRDRCLGYLKSKARDVAGEYD
jgi:hypothetical protein